MLHLFFLTWVPVSRVVGGIPEERLFFYLRPYWFYRTACYHEHKRLGVNSSVTIAISIVGQSRGISIAGHVFNAAATNWFTMMIFFFCAPESLISALILSKTSDLNQRCLSSAQPYFNFLFFSKSAKVYLFIFLYYIYYYIYFILYIMFINITFNI